AANGDLHGQFFYLPSSQAQGAVTYTANFSAARSWKRMIVYQYSYGGVASFDASNRATGTSGSLNSGNITTTGANEVVFGAYGEYNSDNTTTNEQINGQNADNVFRQYHSMWSKTFTSPFTGAATAAGNSSTWIGSIISFKK